VEFVEAPVFTKLLHEYLTDDEYRALQLFLATDAQAGLRHGRQGADLARGEERGTSATSTDVGQMPMPRRRQGLRYP
jgi:hypothetical protein